MFEKLIDNACRKVMHKSSKTVKKEVKKKVKEATTGENGQKLLITSCILSVGAIIFSIMSRSSKPVIVNVYNQYPNTIGAM